MNIREAFSFKDSSEIYKPWRVGLSMSASWAMGASMAAGLSLYMIWGLMPFLVWVGTNIIGVPVFVAIYLYVDDFEEMINLRAVQAFLLLILGFQIIMNQMAMLEALSGGVDLSTYAFLPTDIATYVVMATAGLIMLFIYKYGLPGSIQTDLGQYTLQMVGATTIVATGLLLGYTGLPQPESMAPTSEWLSAATLGLLTAAFVQADQYQRIEKSPKMETGLWAGFFFGIYMMMVVGAAFTFGENSPLHGVLFLTVIFAVGTSTLDSLAAAMQRLIPYRKVALAATLIPVIAFPIAADIGVGSLWGILADTRTPVGLIMVGTAVFCHVVPGIELTDLKTRLDSNAPTLSRAPGVDEDEATGVTDD
jgi:hypothetical protein